MLNPSFQVRRLFASWDPLANPAFAVRELKTLRRHFLIDKDVPKAEDSMEVDVFEDSTNSSNPRAADRTMTAYETLMWTVWLPHVRSSIK